MSKAILISIQPKWAAKILNGEKTIEIRKSMPKCDLPIDVYIYVTKATKKNYLYWDWYDPPYVVEEWFVSKNPEIWADDRKNINGPFNGKIVAKFALNKAEMVEVGTQKDHIEGLYQGFYSSMNTNELLNKSCINSCATILKYAGFDFKHNDNSKCWRKNIYAWHIENLEIFDKPRELCEFYKLADYETILVTKSGWYVKSLTKAPQSWCYVEGEQL